MTGRKPRIVVNKNTPHVVEVFSRIGNVIALETKDVTREALRDADILVVRSETKVNEELLEGSSVRYVGTVTIGTDHVDMEYLSSKGIAFASAPGSNANSVAEYVTAALLHWSKNIGEPLAGKTIGIVGHGNVGKKVAQKAEILGMKILLNDPPLARETGNAQYLSLNALMNADVVTLHVPFTKSGIDSTYHLFGESRMSALKKGSLFINTSRGGVAKTEAVKSALTTGQCSAAILDVWEHEPSIDAGLLAQTMIGTPHIAGYSFDGKTNALKMIYEDVCRFFNIEKEAVQIPALNSEERQIVVDANIVEPMDVVAEAVKKVYDIMYDDTQLRKMSTLPDNEQGSYFMKLRAEYRTRREFFNYNVSLSSEQQSASVLLSGLGFQIV